MKKIPAFLLVLILCFTGILLPSAFGSYIDFDTVYIDVGETFTHNYIPSTYHNPSFSWHVSNSCIQIISYEDGSCTVKGISEGSSTLYCNYSGYTSSGQLVESTDSCKFVVEKGASTRSKVTITFDPQGGNVSQSSYTRISGKTYGSLPTPTKTGYTFNGWFTSGGTRINSSSIVPQNNITLYAKWTDITYSIHFDGNGSTGGTMQDMTDCKYLYSYQLNSNSFIRDGYTFDGWNTADDASGISYKDCATVSKLASSHGATVNLYAMWFDSTKSVSKCDIRLSSESVTYTGNPHRITVTVNNGQTALQEGTDYSLEYKNNINAGTASVVIRGLGAYSGSQTKTFRITKANQSIDIGCSTSELCRNSTLQLSPTGFGTFSYSSSDSALATVSNTGLVTGIKEGTVTITVSTSGDSNHDSAQKELKLTITHPGDMCGENLYWNFADGILSITGTGDMWTYDDNNKYPWFKYRGDITRVEFSDGVTSVSEHAFAFDYGNMISVKLGEGIVNLGDYCFGSSCYLTYVSIPKNVVSIGEYAFQYSNLQSITIPQNVTSIGNGAFKNCKKLQSIRFSGSAPAIANTCFYNVEATAYYPENDPTWTSAVMQDYGGEITWKSWNPNPVFPVSGICGDNITWTLDENGQLTLSGSGAMDSYTVSNKAPWADYSDVINSLSIGNEITKVGSYAFDSLTGLSSVNFSEKLSSIGDYAFRGCTSLEKLTIPKSVKSIGNYAFACCGNLKSLVLQEGLTSIGEYAFCYCTSLTDITIPAGITSISSYTFYHCIDLYSVVLPEGITNIGLRAFANCLSLVSINLPESLETFGGHVFEECISLASIVIPSGITEFGEFDFEECCNLKEVVLQEGLSSIENGLFYKCESLTEITIPDTVKSIEYASFRYCYSLKSITIPNSVISIGEAAFGFCERLTNVTIPNSVTSIERTAFQACDSLKSITIPNSVTSIGEYAFNSCDNLVSITIPNSVTSIEEGTFQGCDSLKSITIPNSVTYIGECALADCERLTNVTIPSSVTYIGKCAFENCYSLIKVIIPSSVKTICAGAFDNCDNITLVVDSGSAAETYAKDNNINYVISGHELFLSVDKEILEFRLGSGNPTVSATLKGNESDLDDYLENYTKLQYSSGNTSAVDFTSQNEMEEKTDGIVFTTQLALQGVGVSELTIQTVDSIGAGYTKCHVVVHSASPATTPKGLKTIGEEAFAGAAFDEVVLTDGVDSVGSKAFKNCSGLKLITIPSSVKAIEPDAFSDCKDLTILCAADSYAYEYAVNNDIPYLVI